jgi:hypothetical protein
MHPAHHLKSAADFVDIVEPIQLGPEATPEDLDAFCEAATAWLAQQDGPSILVRPLVPGSWDTSGLHRVRDGLPQAPLVSADSDDQADRRAAELVREVWERYAAGKLV